jgi:hypothetical protein
MKAVLLVLTIGCVALLCPAAHTTTTDDTSSRQKASQATPQARERAVTTKPKRESVPLPNLASPHRLTNSAKNPAAGKTTNAQRQHLEQRLGPTNAGLRASSGSFQQQSFRPSTLPRPAASTPNNSRRHGPNPAVIGGPKNTTVTNTAALSGRAVHSRP